MKTRLPDVVFFVISIAGGFLVYRSIASHNWPLLGYTLFSSAVVSIDRAIALIERSFHPKDS